MRDADELIRRLCDNYLEWIVEGDRNNRTEARPEDPGEMPYVYSGLLREEAERMGEGDRSSVSDEARSLLKRADLTLEPEEFDRLCYELQRTLLQAYRVCADEWEGDFAGQPREWSPGQLDAAPTLPAASQQRPGSRRKLSKLIGTFLRQSMFR